MKRFTALMIGASLMSASACAQPASGELDREAIEKIVYEYLMENPEVLAEAQERLDEKTDQMMLAAVRDDLESDPRDVSIGPKDAKVTIVEFFDYNCGYCKRSTEWVRKIVDQHPDNVRVVFKELPILDRKTGTSRNAALAALAAGKQGKYPVMHFSLMNETNLTKERVEMIAKKAGVDVAQMRKDMKDDALAEQLEDTMRLAGQVPALTGTPYFIIGDEYVAGANVTRLQYLLDEALKNS